MTSWRRDCPEYVESDDAGKVTFNHLQQSEPDESERPLTPLEEAGTTDIWGITDES